jgi:hypothetical protein
MKVWAVPFCDKITMVKRKTLTKPEDIKIHDGIEAVDSKGNQLLDTGEPAFLGTKPITLSRSHPVKAVNMFLPPGVSKFYVERINKNEIRFLIRTDEINRLAEKAETMMSKPPTEIHD